SGIHRLGTIPDANELLKDLDEDINNVTIIGGGYIGLEAAENIFELGKKVTLIQRGDQVANIFDADMAEIIHNKAEEKGINLILNEEVTGFIGDHYVEKVQTNKNLYKKEVVLLEIDVQLNTKFLIQTNIKNVYAAGDCATDYQRVKQINDYIPLGTTANKQGRIAGANMANDSLTFKGIVGTSIIKFFDITLGKTGITEKEAKSLSIPY